MTPLDARLLALPGAGLLGVAVAFAAVGALRSGVESADAGAVTVAVLATALGAAAAGAEFGRAGVRRYGAVVACGAALVTAVLALRVTGADGVGGVGPFVALAALGAGLGATLALVRTWCEPSIGAAAALVGVWCGVRSAEDAFLADGGLEGCAVLACAGATVWFCVWGRFAANGSVRADGGATTSSGSGPARSRARWVWVAVAGIAGCTMPHLLAGAWAALADASWLGAARASGSAAAAAALGAASAGLGAGRGPAARGLGLAVCALVIAACVPWSPSAIAVAAIAAATGSIAGSQGLGARRALGVAAVAAAVVVDVGGPSPGPVTRAPVAGAFVTPHGGAALQQRAGRLTSAFAPRAERVLVVGFGAGAFLDGLVTTMPADDVTCLEWRDALLEPASAREHAHVEAVASLRETLTERRGVYDLVCGAWEPPDTFGAATRLSAEHFAALRRATTDDGVVVQWVALHLLPWRGFAAVANAFVEEFPTARLFVATPLASEPLVALVGGLDELPSREALDALFAASTLATGPFVATDVYDLHVADAWTLRRRFEGLGLHRDARPISEVVSLGRGSDARMLARVNTRLLAGLATPLRASAVAGGPVEDAERVQWGTELEGRGRALAALLRARARSMELDEPRALGESAFERGALEDALDADLVAAWRVWPGRPDARVALLERSTRHLARDRVPEAARILDAAIRELTDAALVARLGLAFLHLDRAADALHVLDQAAELFGDDPGVEVARAAALARLERDDDARRALRSAAARAPLPPLAETVLALLEDQPGARDVAAEVVAVARRRVDPSRRWDDAWIPVLERLAG